MNNSNETKERKKLDLKRITDSRVFWMILSLLAASLLWMYVTTTEGVEVEKTLTGVKIEFLGADAMRASSDLIVTEQDRTTVNLTLSGTRRVLSKLTNSNVTATVNLSTVAADGRYSVSYDISYPAGVNANEITLVHTSSDVVNFYVDKLARKTIEDIVFEPIVGALYFGEVKRIISNLGAFIELAPGKDAMCHIKDLEFKRTEKVEDVLNIGDKTWVKFTGIDEKGRWNISRKEAIKELGEDKVNTK